MLLCTDGLHGVLQPAVLKQLLETAGEIDAVPKRLVEAALAHGTRDNLTALVVRYEAD